MICFYMQPLPAVILTTKAFRSRTKSDKIIRSGTSNKVSCHRTMWMLAALHQQNCQETNIW